MRTDMKIGILAGLIVALGIVVYLFSRGGGEKPQQPPANPAPPAHAAPAPTASTPPSSSGDSAVRIGGSLIIDSGQPTSVSPGPLPPTPAPTEVAAGAPVTPAPAPAPTVTPGPTPPPSEPLRLAPTLEMPSATVTPSAPTPAPAPAITPITPVSDTAVTPVAAAASASGERTYVVEKGDVLWTIAEKIYGDGTKHTLIAKANKLENGQLRIGQKLVIPAAPAAPAPAVADVAKPGPAPFGAPVTPGDTSVPTPVTPVAPAPVTPTTAPASAAGATEYVVKEGDGYWSIAQKVYGDGAKWYVIEKANKVDSRQLRVGMKLVIPKLAEAAKPVKEAPTTRPAASKASAPAVPAKTPEPVTDGRPRFY